MSKQYFLPRRIEMKAIAFEQFRDNVDDYVALFSLDVADVAQQAEDATYFRGLLPHTQTMVATGQQWIGWRNNVLTGTSGGEPVMVTRPVDLPASLLNLETPIL